MCDSRRSMLDMDANAVITSPEESDYLQCNIFECMEGAHSCVNVEVGSSGLNQTCNLCFNHSTAFQTMCIDILTVRERSTGVIQFHSIDHTLIPLSVQSTPSPENILDQSTAAVDEINDIYRNALIPCATEPVNSNLYTASFLYGSESSRGSSNPAYSTCYQTAAEESATCNESCCIETVDIDSSLRTSIPTTYEVPLNGKTTAVLRCFPTDQHPVEPQTNSDPITTSAPCADMYLYCTAEGCNLHRTGVHSLSSEIVPDLPETLCSRHGFMYLGGLIDLNGMPKPPDAAATAHSMTYSADRENIIENVSMNPATPISHSLLSPAPTHISMWSGYNPFASYTPSVPTSSSSKTSTTESENMEIADDQPERPSVKQINTLNRLFKTHSYVPLISASSVAPSVMDISEDDDDDITITGVYVNTKIYCTTFRTTIKGDEEFCTVCCKIYPYGSMKKQLCAGACKDASKCHLMKIEVTLLVSIYMCTRCTALYNICGSYKCDKKNVTRPHAMPFSCNAVDCKLCIIYSSKVRKI